jgi:hypothetical protein
VMKVMNWDDSLLVPGYSPDFRVTGRVNFYGPMSSLWIAFSVS